MDAGDGLHQPAVAVAETEAVDGLHPAHVRGAVAGHGNARVAGHDTGHARAPEILAADTPVDEIVDAAERIQRALDALRHRRDELEE